MENETPFVDFGRKDQYSVPKLAMGDTSSILPTLKNRGQKWYAISNYGECSGWVNQYFKCVKEGITPILGMQLYVNNYRFTMDGEVEKVHRFANALNGQLDDAASNLEHDELDWSTLDFPIDVFARTMDGYYNIIKLHNDAQINGMDKRPRTQDEFVASHGKGVVALLPTPFSEFSMMLFNNETTDALKVYEFYKQAFDDVYVEVPIVECEDYREINARVISFCNKHDIKLIPVINAHYDERADAEMFPIFQKVGSLKGGVSFEVEYTPNMYCKTSEEVWDTFKQYHESDVFTEDQMRKLLLGLDELCKTFTPLELDTSPKTPHFENSDVELREHAWKGFEKYGFDKKPNADEYKRRLEYELDNIIRAGFADYFILIERMFDWHINKMGRLGSTGRGSASGSLTLRCLGVTKIDPLEHNLLFERFLDASRLDEIINKGGKLSGSDFPDVDCFAMHTLVISENGIKEIKDVVEGEMMMTRDGTYHAIEKIVDYRNAPIVRVVYGDWYFDCTINHRVLIRRADTIEYKYVYELMRGDCLVQDENTFIPIEEVCQEKIVKMVRDLKIEGKHCFRVCGKAYNRVILKDGQQFFLSDSELNWLQNQDN